MNEELKTKWTTALRSGAFKQCQGELYGILDSGQKGYCCLGVLCRVIGFENKDLFQKDTLDSVGKPELLGPWNASNRDLHFSAHRPETHTTIQRQLAAMNDDSCTFDEIAAWIDENVPADSSAQASPEHAADCEITLHRNSRSNAIGRCTCTAAPPPRHGDLGPKCESCGKLKTWCSQCRVWTQTCCVEYGTCQCN